MAAGLIVWWYGSLDEIPVGWRLCDGLFGTPDLRNRFMIGAGDIYAVGDSGNSLNHNHPFTGSGHSHGLYPDTYGASSPGPFMTTIPGTLLGYAAGTTDNETWLPPYKSLVYLMRES